MHIDRKLKFVLMRSAFYRGVHGRCCVSVNFGLCRPCAIGTGERRNKTCQLLINLVSSCVLINNYSPKAK